MVVARNGGNSWDTDHPPCITETLDELIVNKCELMVSKYPAAVAIVKIKC